MGTLFHKRRNHFSEGNVLLIRRPGKKLKPAGKTTSRSALDECFLGAITFSQAITAKIASMTKALDQYLKDELTDRATVFGPGQGEILNINGGRITLKVTSSISRDQLGVYEIYLEPGTVGAQSHYHRYMDETFVVTTGTLAVTHGQTKVNAGAGSVVHVPRFTPHAFANESDQPVTVMLIFNPAQNREGFFYGLQTILNATPFNPADFLALYQKYDSFPAPAGEICP